MNTIDTLKSDKRVWNVSDERLLGDGYWIYLEIGYCSEQQGQHFIHEDSPSKCLKMFSTIRKCFCPDCPP